ncbi:MAG TPA: hypothetical protein VGH63_00960 [Polyangia bacterium]
MLRTNLIALALLSAATARADPTPKHPMALPTEYVTDRFYVTPTLANGAKLRCYTDSGGGGAFVFDDRLKPLGGALTKRKEGGQTLVTTPWPRFAVGAAIPQPLSPPYFIVLPRGGFGDSIDCFLGQSWFGGRTWTFDYAGKTLWWRAPGDLPAHDKAHETKLTFKEGAWFPRIVVSIDGEDVPLLFDTGATITSEGMARGGSFITTRTLEKWRKKHPDWRIVDGGDVLDRGKLRTIEVPAVVVGGFSVGPVIFAERADKNFDDFMSSFMAAHVEGALGGSALHYLRVTVDYARGVAVFEKP